LWQGKQGGAIVAVLARGTQASVPTFLGGPAWVPGQKGAGRGLEKGLGKETLSEHARIALISG